MKIISGIYKGRVLDGFTLDKTRPTMDRVKESLFAMIQDYLPDSIVLDLFSGSGNLGFEALSEGAKEIYLVDNNRKAIEVIKKNADKLGCDGVNIIHNDYLKALDNFDKNMFDIIFLDPPYNTTYINKSLNKIRELNILKDNGLIVCETDDLKRIDVSKFKVSKQKKYGNKYIVILKIV